MTLATDSPPRPLPRIDVIVAVHDEAATIEGKIRNLEALDYPPDLLRFFIVDGDSTDGTASHIARWAAGDHRVVRLETGRADKALQLNAALARTTAEWVLVTDADARMPPRTLRAMAGELRADPEVAVVGTLASTPGHELEEIHWRVSNWIRRRERRLGTAGLVIATCYLFRRALVDRFPADCAADDVHLACRAAAVRARVGLAEVTVLETRAPASVGGILAHKMRRTRGYLREVLRFLPFLSRMPGPMRIVFAWRALALIGIPVATAFALVPLGVAALGWQPSMETALVSTGFLALVLGGSWAAGRRRSRRPWALLAYPALTLAILSLALLSYPFTRRTARLERIGTV